MRFRLLDTGASSAAFNMAADQVLLEGAAQGTSPPTLRFMRFDPPAVLVGAFQRVENEVRLDWCQEHGIHLNRRITGGGTIFFDPPQLGWEIVCRREHLGAPWTHDSLFERLCEPVVRALRALGIDAAFRPRNDIEVQGRKISGSGGTALRDAILFQGTLLTDFDADTMVRALRVPVEKLRKREIETLTERVTWIGRELGESPSHESLTALIADSFASSLGIGLDPGGLLAHERAAIEDALPYHASDDWIAGRGRKGTEHVRALYPTPGGMLRPLIACSASRDRIQSIVLDGDFFAFPQRGVFDLEAALKGVSARRVGPVVEDLFARKVVNITDIEHHHVTAAILEALDRGRATALGLTLAQANSTFPLGCPLGSIRDLAPTHLLLPYCAKPLDCEHRHEDACDQCGRCAIGDAYETAGAMGLCVHTITSFEHLMDTMSDLSGRHVPSFIGTCCEPFYVKHREEMEAHRLPGVLFDVAGNETCYDLGKGSLAHEGRYEGLSVLDTGLLETLLEITCHPGKP